MKYKFNYQISALDLWKLSMYGTYSSFVGVANIIFTIAMLLLAIRFWVEVNNFRKILLIIGISLFTIIQPLVVYIRAKSQVANFPQDMEISFDDYGIWIKTSNQISDIKWSTIKRIIKKPNMIIIFTTPKHGFIMSDKILGQEKKDLFNYIVSKVQD